jgi:hypothetical protein
MASSLENSAWLQWMASLMGGARQTESATFPLDRYFCMLDEMPLHLLPQAARRRLQEPQERGLVLNPECTLRAATDLPYELCSRPDLVSGFALHGTIAWVRDSDQGTLLPFWLGSAFEALLRDLRPNEPVSTSIPDATRGVLAGAGILIPSQRTLPNGRAESMRNAATQFAAKGYAPLVTLIHPFHVAALRRYFRQQIRTGAIHLGDGQSTRRYIAHNEPVARFFHHLLTPTLSEVAGKTLKPSYVYLASYLAGAELKKHTDREQCDYSVTFCFDYSPEPALATPWPIRLQTRGGTVSVYQALGDGLAYRGTQLPHYRDRLGEGQTSTSIFFHYVTEDFAGSLD